jgi:hypothetical protein
MCLRRPNVCQQFACDSQAFANYLPVTACNSHAFANNLLVTATHVLAKDNDLPRVGL